jgi:RNA polymerase sigma-70 factor (sigma-E family)
VLLVASEDEFTEFVAGALPRLLRFGHVLTGNPAAAEDLVQTALGRSLRAWRAHRINDPHAYVRKAMVNAYASSWRHRRLTEVVISDPVLRMPEVDEAKRVDDRDAVWRALLVLPPRQRAVIVLRYYEDLSEREIAAVMGTSAGTVKSQSARALRRLAGLLASSSGAAATTDRGGT